MRLKWLFERQTVLGFVLAFALLAFAGVVSHGSLRQFDETSRWLTHTHEVLANLESGQVDLLNVQTGMRGFVLTGEPRYLEPYEQSLPKISTQLARLRQLTAGDSRQQKRLNRLDLLVPQFLGEMKLRLETRQQKGFNAAVEQVVTGKGKRLMDEIRAVFAEMEADERQLLKVRTEAAAASARQAILVSSVSSLLAILLFGFSFRLIRRQIQHILQAEMKARDARVFAESIVDTVREPLLVLRGDLRTVSANRSFYEFFQVSQSETLEKHLFELGDGQWDIPGLRDMLEHILPQNSHFDDLEIANEFPKIGRRTLLLNARKLYREGNNTNLILLAIEDVTESRAAGLLREQAAEQQHRALRLLDATHDGVFMFDPQTLRFFYVNQGAMDQTGYSREELLTMTPLDIKPEFDPPGFRRMLAPLLVGTSSSHTFTTVHRRKDGRDVPVEIILQCVDLDSGNRNMVAIVRDITKRRQIEEERDRFFTLSRDMNSIVGFDGYFKRLNPAWEKTLGFTAAELLAAPYLSFVHPEDRVATSAEAAKLASGLDTISFENRYRCKDGSYKWLLWSSAPSVNHQLIYAVAHDITVRKQAEEALAQSEERFRQQTVLLKSMLDCMGDGVVAADENGKFLVFNPAAERILGTGANGNGPERWSERYGFYLLDGKTPFPPHMLPLARAMRGESAEGVQMIVRPSGASEEIWISVTGNPLRRADGSLRGGVIIFRDITMAKNAEHVLRLAKEEAERASKFKDQFLSTMSHELRTPLNAVMGFSELLTDESYGPLNDRQRRYLGHIRNGGQHLLKLISDILDLSRIEAGRLELTPENISVEAVFSEALETIRPLATKKSQTLAQHAEPGLALRADATRLRQVLLNLLGNAVKFTPDGGSIELAALREGDEVRVEVRDTGPGIPLEEQQHVFQTFFRLRRPGQANEGTGLGLAITTRLVELHGGRLELKSQPGKGSCFFFRLPTVEALPRTQEAPVALAPSVGEPGPILVVEDDPVAAQLIRSQLVSAGYRVAMCDASEQALEMAVELQPAAITLDILMNPVNGWEVLSRLRASPAVEKIPVVVVTVVDQPGMGIALGADDYLVKPVDKTALLAAVKRCLARRGVSAPVRPILVVEDDAATREMIGDLVSAQGYPCTSAADGQQAREWVAASLPELVILDLMLPHVSGFDLLSEWRGQPRTANLPVFVLTGKDLTREEAAFLRSHTELLLSKQQSWQQSLVEQLRRVLTVEQEVGP